MDKVILVDSRDIPTGTMEKMEAHEKGMLHRAFSILLFNSDGKLLIQQRASDKYHSGGLWTNTCCSHPKPGEPIEEAVQRRLKEEMGIKAKTEFLYKFLYRYDFFPGLTEHELDHVFIGFTDQHPDINKKEVADWRWISMEELHNEIKADESRFTFWFIKIIERLTGSAEFKPKSWYG